MCVFIRIREREREGESTGEKGRKDRCKDRRRVEGRKERIKEGKKECFNKKITISKIWFHHTIINIISIKLLLKNRPQMYNSNIEVDFCISLSFHRRPQSNYFMVGSSLHNNPRIPLMIRYHQHSLDKRGYWGGILFFKSVLMEMSYIGFHFL